MLSKYPYIALGMLVLLCILIGWSIRGLVENANPLSKAMAWGYDEHSNMWNRIRVDDKGHVICNTRE